MFLEVSKKVQKKFKKTEKKIKAKGENLDLITLLGSDNMGYINKFINGTMIQIVLLQNNYHRFHSPVFGKIVDTYKIQGGYFQAPFNDYLQRNTRGIVIMDTFDYGLTAFVAIGVNEFSSVNISINAQQTLQKGSP